MIELRTFKDKLHIVVKFVGHARWIEVTKEEAQELLVLLKQELEK